jgi:glycyl-tRNA synthetase
MEMQYLVQPETADEKFEYWREERMNWYQKLGIKQDKLRFHQHGDDELAHYAAKAFDIEYEYPFGWHELEGIHNRTDFDLKQHQEYSGKDLRYFDDQTREKFIPYIIETSAGVDRTLLTCLVDAYDEEEVKGDLRTVLRLSPEIAPLKVGVFPLVKRDGMPDIARNIVDQLRKFYPVFYDESGAIGRRYRRQDEAGTPFCVTVDAQTLEDNTVTLRERDSMQQERAQIDKLIDVLRDKIH